MLLIQRNKLKCSEGWKDTNQQLHRRSSQDLLRTPRCQGVSRTLVKDVRLETEAQHAENRQALRPTEQTTELAARSQKQSH